MKKSFALLLLVALTAAGLCVPALAENAVLTQEDLLGVWVSESNPNLSFVILPGSYAERFGENSGPELFMECRWPEEEYCDVIYRLDLEEVRELLHSFFGPSFIGAAFNALNSQPAGNNEGELSILTYNYKGGSLNVVFNVEDDEPINIPLEEPLGGKVYLIDDGTDRYINWEDDHDPHTLAHFFIRKFESAPGPEALLEHVVRPVIDMDGDTQNPTVQALLKYAVEIKAARVDGAQLQEALSAALSGLSKEDLQAFSEHCAALLPDLDEATLHADAPVSPVSPVAEELWSCHMLTEALRKAPDPD